MCIRPHSFPCLFLLLAALLLRSQLAFSQQIIFQKSYTLGSYGYAVAYDVIPTQDGGYLLAGEVITDTITGQDYFILKTNADGDSLWSRIYAEPEAQGLHAIRQTPDGGYLAGGFTYLETAGKDDAEILRLDSVGNILWRQKTGGASFDYLRDLELLPDGSFVWTGGEGDYATLKKMDAQGDLLWNRTFGNAWVAWGMALERLPDGGFAVAGMLQLSVSDWEMYLIRTDSNGQVVWEKQYGYSHEDLARDVKITPDGCFLLAGTHNQPNSQAAMLKIDSLGNRIADLGLGFAWEDYFASVEVQDLNNYVWIGGIRTPDSLLIYNSDGFFAGTNSDFDTLWSLSVNNTDFQFYQSSCKSPDGGIIAAGYVRDYRTIDDWSDTLQVFLIKINGLPLPDFEPSPGLPGMMIFPNPAVQSAAVQLPAGVFSSGTLKVFDTKGRQWARVEVNSSSEPLKLDLHDFPSGSYFLHWVQNRRVRAIGKMIVQH